MSSYVSADLRQHVESRANQLCEYCLIHEDDTFLGCQVDHIIAEKHGGPTEADNLCLACTFCNRGKGSDIASIAGSTGQLVRLYNPRTDRWSDHFVLMNAIIEPRTEIGEATAKILGFNEADRIQERALLRDAARYPPEQAAGLLASVET